MWRSLIHDVTESQSLGVFALSFKIQPRNPTKPWPAVKLKAICVPQADSDPSTLSIQHAISLTMKRKLQEFETIFTFQYSFLQHEYMLYCTFMPLEFNFPIGSQTAREWPRMADMTSLSI